MNEAGEMKSSKGERVAIPGALIDRFHEPSSVNEVVRVVEEAARDKTGLLIAGGRTRLNWGSLLLPPIMELIWHGCTANRRKIGRALI